MYHVTELIGKFDKTNHKKIISTLVDRKNHSFNSLKELAHFTREHYIFTSYQEQCKQVDRTVKTSDNLYLENNLLWIDLDCKVDLADLRERMIENNLLGFAYYTSKFYTERKKHARLCIILEKPFSKDLFHSCKFFAQDIVNLLDLNYTVDAKIYSNHMYLSKVPFKLENKQFFITSGEPYKVISLERKIKEFKKSKVTDSSPQEETLSFIKTLLSFPEIERAIPRNNDTISISFKDIPEKTKHGYFLDPTNPWFIHHPNKKTKFISTFLKKSFKKFKQFCSTNVKPDDPFKNYLKNANSISEAFINPLRFKQKESLIFIESPTGTGKTTAIAEYIQNKKSVLFISVNRMQAVATKRSLSIKGVDFDCYLKSSLKEYIEEKESGKKIYKNRKVFNNSFIDNAKQGILPDKLICGILSLHHLIKNNTLIKEYDYIIIDEITTIPNSTSLAQKLVVPALPRFEKSMEAFYLLLRNAKKVICMDGFISNPIVKCISDISGKTPYIIQNNIPTNKRIEIYCSRAKEPTFNTEREVSCPKFFNHLKNDLENAKFEPGKRVMVVALSELKKSNTLVNYINQTKESKTLRVFNKDITEENGEEVISLFENFDFYVQEEKIDIVVYSPTITTGIDIPQAKGTNVYQIMAGNYLSAQINYQMTMRGRQAKTYRVLIPKESFIMQNVDISSLLDRINILTTEYPTTKKLRKGSVIEETKGFNCNFSGTMLCYLEVAKSEFNQLPFLKAVKALSEKRKGLITALRIDNACVEFQNDCFEYGNTLPDQYINFLKHEKCNISIEEDIDTKDYDYSNKEEEYLSNVLKKFEIINYTAPSTSSTSTLYRKLNQVLTAQRILYYILNKDESTPTSIKNTSEVVEKVFNKVKTDYKELGKGYIKYENLEKLYRFLYSYSHCSKFVLENYNSLKVYDERVYEAKQFLKLFFELESDINPKSNKKELKGYYLHPIKDILDSLENIGKNHRLYLLITDVL